MNSCMSMAPASSLALQYVRTVPAGPPPDTPPSQACRLSATSSSHACTTVPTNHPWVSSLACRCRRRLAIVGRIRQSILFPPLSTTTYDPSPCSFHCPLAAPPPPPSKAASSLSRLPRYRYKQPITPSVLLLIKITTAHLNFL